MLNGAFGNTGGNSLMSEYSSLLVDAMLRQRTHVAEQSARIESELANKVKSEFIGNMSHELRTPLNTVIGFSKILAQHEQQQLSAKVITDYAKLIRDAADHLLLVINDVLDISKIQSGKYTLEPQEVQVDEVLHSALSLFRTLAADSGVVLRERISFDMPPVRGDAGKLKQVFSNLISNAVKFTNAGGHVTVEAKRSNSGVAIIVSDTGIGMSEEEIEVALKLFGQVDGTRARWREGAGLGLPIAYALVGLHGGELQITSRKDLGTEVAVLLPPADKISVAQARELIAGRNLGLG